jgi:putative copper resistance protein D
VGGLYLMYFGGVYEYALRNHPAHLAMYVHFLLSGFLFFAVLISPDPLPRRLAYPARFAVLLGALALHAFFGVALMQTANVIAADWFTDLARPWGPDPLTDQRVGGGIAWAIGEAPALIVALILFRQWVRADEREQRRLDRAADRDGDAKLIAYNEWLAAQRVVDDLARDQRESS